MSVEWVEVTGRITVDIVLAPKETRLPFDREAWVADLLDQWWHTKDYILSSYNNQVTVNAEVVKIKDLPEE